jgi:hypothetical protein
MLHAPETPEIYFMDFGDGRLVNGRAHVDLDPRFAGTVTVDEHHPMRVFIQLEEDENIVGVVVKNKTADGFDVVERLGGRSSAPFQWHVVCNRADEVLPDGQVSQNADMRFQPLRDPEITLASVNKGLPGLPTGTNPSAEPPRKPTAGTDTVNADYSAKGAEVTSTDLREKAASGVSSDAGGCSLGHASKSESGFGVLLLSLFGLARLRRRGA